jgi:DNA-binding response OmpR family regulator
MKLLLIEDNQKFIERITAQLSRVCVIDVVTTGSEGISKALATEYEVIILDIGLPDISGIVVCRHLRQARMNAPILILTRLNDMNLRVKLLDMGADDYLTKPFDGEELRARVTALARRQRLAYVSPILKFRDLVIDIQQRKVYRSGVHITLRRKEFDILAYLVSNRGRILTREMILSHAWGSSRTCWSSTVDVHIKHLRDKIDRPFSCPLIKTAYGIGYQIDVLE